MSPDGQDGDLELVPGDFASRNDSVAAVIDEFEGDGPYGNPALAREMRLAEEG